MKTIQRKVPVKRRRRRVPVRPTQATRMPSRNAEPITLSSQNLAKILSGFMTFRSTVQDVSKSLAKLESVLNTTYQMFETVQRVAALRKSNQTNPLFSLFSPKSANPPTQSLLPLPNNPGNSQGSSSPFLSLFEHLDFKQILALMQSPLVQGLIGGLFQQKSTPTRKRGG